MNAELAEGAEKNDLGVLSGLRVPKRYLYAAAWIP